MLNSTLQSENLNSSNINSILDDIVSDSIVLFISLFGIFTNIGAIFILSATPSIRRSRPFTLLVNQCLMDTVALVMIQIGFAAKYALKSDGLHGIWDQFRCHLLDNGILSSIHTCASSYNLAALSGERMFSVVWPIPHRIYFTPKNMRRAAFSIWLFSVITMFSHSVGTNGIAPDFRCYYWTVRHGISSKMYAISFNLTFSICPFAIMVACFVAMYYKIIVNHMKVKINIIRVLGTCVIIYFVLHIPVVTISFLYRFGYMEYVEDTLLNIILAALVINTFINPIVYLLQYNDYNREFRRQVNRMLGRKMASVAPVSSLMSSTSRNDSLDTEYK